MNCGKGWRNAEKPHYPIDEINLKKSSEIDYNIAESSPTIEKSSITTENAMRKIHKCNLQSRKVHKHSSKMRKIHRKVAPINYII